MADIIAWIVVLFIGIPIFALLATTIGAAIGRATTPRPTDPSSAARSIYALRKKERGATGAAIGLLTLFLGALLMAIIHLL